MFRRSVDERSDLYSVGVVLFEMVAGRPPFVAPDVGRLVRSHAVERPPDLCSLAPAAGPGLRAVTERLLAKDPDDRYPTAVMALDAVRALRHDTDPARSGSGDRRLVPTRFGGRGGAGDLVARHRLRADLRQRWRRAAAGAGGVALVRGPAGGGKTSRVWELAATVEAGGGLVLSGKGSIDEPSPLGPLRSALDQWLGHLRCRTDPAATDALDKVTVAARQAGPLIGVIAPSLVDGPGGIETDRSGQLPGVIAGFLLELADRFGGLLLHLDDVQWIDASTVRVVDQLVDELLDRPLLVVGTARVSPDAAEPVDRFGAVAADRLDLDIELGPLTDDEVHELIRNELPGAELDDRICRTLAARGDGNPFVVREFLRAVVDAGLLTPNWGRWRLDEAGLHALELPDDVLGLVLSRVDGIGGSAREALTVGAALGGRFDPAIVVDVVAETARAGDGDGETIFRNEPAGGDDPADVVRKAVAEAVDRHLLEPQGTEMVFVHDRVREALLGPLDADRAARLHLRIAQVLERRSARAVPDGPDAADPDRAPGVPDRPRPRPDLVYALAHHYRLAGELADRRRLHETCGAAGEQALSEQAPETAVPFFAAALAAGTGTEDHSFRFRYGSALRETGDFTGAIEQFEVGAELAPTATERAEVLLGLANVYVASWETAEAYDLLREVLTLVDRPVPTGRLGTFRAMLATLATLLAVPPRLDRAEDRLYVEAHNISVYVSGQDLALGRMLFHSICAAVGSRRLSRTHPEYVIAVAGFGTALGTAGLRRTSERVLSRSERAAAATGDPHLQALVSWCWGVTAYLANWDDGQAWARTVHRHGRWLETAKYLDATASLGAYEAFLGRSDALALWNSLGRRRVAAAPSLEFAALVTYDALIAYQQGRFVEASREMARIRERFGSMEASGARLILLLTEVRGLLEQDDLGPELDDAVAEMYRLAGGPSRMVRQFRDVTVYHALALLGWARRVPDGERPERVEAARRAVRLTGRERRSSQVMAAQPILEADLLLLQDRPEDAWRRVASWRPPLPDAPLLSYEAARVRARALLVLGDVGEAARTATLAREIAIEHGWQYRARNVEAEFGTAVAPSGRSGSSGPGAGTPARAPRSVGGPGRSERQVEALEQVNRAVARVVDPDDVARVALEQIIALLNAERAFLFLVADLDRAADHDGIPGPERAAGNGGDAGAGDPGPDRLVQRLGRDDHGQDLAVLTGYSASVVERVRHTRQAVVVTGSDEAEAVGARSIVQHGLRSIMAAPLELDGRLLGVVYLDSRLAKGIFTEDDVGVLRALCTPIATALETSRAYRLEASVVAERRRRDLAEALRESASRMAVCDTPRQVLRVLVASTLTALGVDRAWIVLGPDPEPGEAGGEDDGGAGPGPVDIIGERDGDGHEPPPSAPDGLRQLTGLTEPTSGRPGGPAPWDALIGWYWLSHPLDGMGSGSQLVIAGDLPVDDDQREVLAVLATQASTAYTRAALLQRVQRLATTDELTGLANRRHLFDLADRWLAGSDPDGPAPAVVMVDIDRFKRINDDHGHPTGDDVIRGVAGRLRDCLGPDDLIGRYGGEEFAVVIADGRRVARTADRLLAAVESAPLATRSGDLPITVSIGGVVRRAAVPGADGAETVESMLGRADAALYRAKDAGRNQVVIG
ncbi:MAG: diguanylate cyclase [Acidimicrobiales bacterium]